MRESQDRAGLGHPVAAEEIDATIERGSGQPFRQGRAANNYLPMAQIHFAARRAVQHHVQYGGHTMGESDLLLPDERAQHVGRIAAGINLFDAQHRCDIRNAPRVHVEHGRDRHVHIRVMNSLLPGGHSQRSQARQRVQHHLPMAIADTFRPVSGGGRVERCGFCVLVEVGEFVIPRTGIQQLFILDGELEQSFGLFRAVCEEHELLHRLDAIFHGFQQGQEIAVHQKDIIFGVINGVENFLRREADINGMQHGAHHRNPKVAFQVTMAVPIHHAYGVARFDSEVRQPVRKAPGALAQCAVAVALEIAVNDLLFGRAHECRLEKMFNDQLVVHVWFVLMTMGISRELRELRRWAH